MNGLSCAVNKQLKQMPPAAKSKKQDATPTSMGKTTRAAIQANSTAPLAFTKAQVAALLNISQRSVARLADRGLLRPIRILRRPLFSAQQVRQLLEEEISWK